MHPHGAAVAVAKTCDSRYGGPMSRKPRTLPRQRRNQRGAVEDRWRERLKDADDNTIEMSSAAAGEVTRWRARYVVDAGREHTTRAFDRKVDAQKWIERQLSALLRGDHFAPRDAKLTVGEWCDKWLAGYGTRRKSTVAPGRDPPQDHQGTLRVDFAVGSQALRRTRLDRHAQARRPRRLLHLRAVLPALPALHRRRPRRPRRTQPRVRGGPHPAWDGSGRTSRPPRRRGRSTTRCRPAYVPRSCPAPTPDCASPRRRGSGSRTSTSRRA